MQLNIVTPDGVVYQNEIDQVTVPTTTGYITILPGHIALISVLQAGEMTIKHQNSETALAVSGGVAEIKNTGEINILADTAERSEHIDVARAEAGRARAEELMAQTQAIDEVAFAAALAKMEKELARLHVAKKYRPS